MADTKLTVDEKAGTITLTLPISPKSKPSDKGNLVIASTRGNKTFDATYKGKVITVGCNAYIEA